MKTFQINLFQPRVACVTSFTESTVIYAMRFSDHQSGAVFLAEEDWSKDMPDVFEVCAQVVIAHSALMSGSWREIEEEFYWHVCELLKGKNLAIENDRGQLVWNI